MVPLLTSNAPLSSSGKVERFSAPPGLMVMREPPPLTNGFPELARVAPLLMVMTPSLLKAVALRVLALSVTTPLELLTPPSQVSGPLLVRLPPLMKALRKVVPVGTILAPASAVTPLRVADAVVENCPGPMRKPPLTRAPARVTLALAADWRRPEPIAKCREVVALAL